MNILRKYMEKEIKELKPVLFTTYNAIQQYQEMRTEKNAQKVRTLIRQTSQLLKPFIPHIPEYKQRFLLALLAIDDVKLSVAEEIFLLDEAVGEMHIRLRRVRAVGELNQPWTEDLLDLLNKRRNAGLIEELGVKKEANKIDRSLLKGLGIQTGKVKGTIQRIPDSEQFATLERGRILVTRMTTPDIFSYFGRLTGIITEEGGRLCHAAILAREFQIPCIVGCQGVLKTLETGQVVTLDSEKGEIYITQ